MPSAGTSSCRAPIGLPRIVAGVVLVVAAMCAALAPGESRANTPTNITAAEIALLPPFCAHTQSFEMRGNPSAPTDEQRRLLALMGPTLWDMHHYCWALVNMHRADGAVGNRAQRRYLLEWAIKDCFYVIKQAPANFVLLPEIFTRVGDLYVLLDQVAEAMPHFERAIELKPDYWPPYVRLAEINLSIGRRAAAEGLLKQGLEAMPDEPHLTKALAQIKRAESAR